jgi:hypothetical protein
MATSPNDLVTLNLQRMHVQNLIAALDQSIGCAPNGQRLTTASTLLPIAVLLQTALESPPATLAPVPPVEPGHAE